MTRISSLLLLLVGVVLSFPTHNRSAFGKTPRPRNKPAKKAQKTTRPQSIMTVLGKLSNSMLLSIRKRKAAKRRRACKAQVARYGVASCCGGSMVYWNGKRCVRSILMCGCVCSGPDCWKQFKTVKACQRTYSHCLHTTRKKSKVKLQSGSKR